MKTPRTNVAYGLWGSHHLLTRPQLRSQWTLRAVPWRSESKHTEHPGAGIRPCRTRTDKEAL